MNVAIQRVETILTSAYSVHNYTDLIREIFPTVKIIAPDRFRKEYTNFSSHIEGSAHVGTYNDPEGNTVIIHAVQLKKETYVETSRSTQRSYAKKLMEAGNADAAIIAFYTDGDPKWRISFVRLDYEIKFENGKMSTAENLTPAKRYSYLVGKDEPCHTAISRFHRFIMDDPNAAQPTLDDLEEAFSVEKVTEEFFNLYCEKFQQLREALEANPDFVEEAEDHNFTSSQFAKKLMGQIVFLYFLQKKGWLGVGMWKKTLTKKQYDKVFYSYSGARRRLVQQYLSSVYGQKGEDEFCLRPSALDQIPDDAEELIANALPDQRGWGSGSKTFMRTLYRRAIKKGGNFFDDYLEPLFYNALNVNRGEKGYDPELHCRVPFLSGGLFEPIDGYEWKHNDFAIPNEIFSNREEKGERDADGILDIFDRYNFTMSEDEPLEREVAIDPEMLGKVFENLLEVNDRKSKGAFYTPREIVHYMCQETLISYLVKETGLDESDIRDFILMGDFMKDADTSKDKRQGNNGMFISENIYKIDEGGNVVVNRLKDIDDALANIRVADPAVGSGAFPLGMLNEIVRARQTISAYMAITMNAYETRMMYNNERSPYSLKVKTIKNCIFAADIEPSAVDITRLRLWLSLVIDDEINPNAQSPLDGHRNPIPLPNLECNIVCGNSLIDEFEGTKLVNYSDILGNNAGQQQNLFQSTFDAILPSLLQAQDELFCCQDPAKKQEWKDTIDALKNELAKAQMQQATPGQWERYQEAMKQASRPFVLWQIDFARVFREKGGFDVVIGNPPYGARFSAKEKKILNRIYEGCCVPDYESADFFIELGYSLSRKGGMLSYIVPNMFMANIFAEKYRKHLLQTWVIDKIDNLSDIDVFDSATVRNSIIFFEASRPQNVSLLTKLTIDGGIVKQLKAKTFTVEDLTDHIDNWLNLIEKDEMALSITNKMSQSSRPLSDFSEISQGLIPYDKYRGHTPEQIKNKVWNADYQKDDTYRKELRGKDVSRYSLSWNGKDWISYGEWLAAPRRPAFFKDPRILVREITSPRILATYTDEEYYNTPSIINCIEFKVDIFFALGVINSELMSFYHNIISPKASKGLFPKILVKDVRNIPIKATDPEIINEISARVKKLLDEENNDNEVDSEIDDLVYCLYDITPDERLYIQKWFEERRK